MTLKELLNGNDRPVMIPRRVGVGSYEPHLGYSGRSFPSYYPEFMELPVICHGTLHGCGDWLGYVELGGSRAVPLIIWIQWRPTELPLD